MASSAHLLPPTDRASPERPEKKQKLMSEGSNEENRTSVSEGSGEEKMDSSCCGMAEECYDDNANFDLEGEPEEDSDDDLMGALVAFLRGKFDLEGPRAESWRRCADYSKLALEKYNKDNGTNYELVEVVKVNTLPVAGVIYYITFTAKDAAAAADGVPKVFQACVDNLVETGVEVCLCRLKPTN